MYSVFFLTLLAAGLALILNETAVVPPVVNQYDHMTAEFGVQTRDSTYQRSAPLVAMNPIKGCGDIVNKDELNGAIVLVKRGSCKFIDQARNIYDSGGVGMVVGNYQGTLIWMSKPYKAPNVYIPCVSVSKSTYDSAQTALTTNPAGTVIATISKAGAVPSPDLWTFPNLIQIITYLLIVFPVVWVLVTIKHFCRRGEASREQRRRQIRNRDIPEILFTQDLLDPEAIGCRKKRLTNSSCPICLENFVEQIKIKLLPCEHGFHSECIGPWIADHSDSCPICRQTVKLEDEEHESRCCCHCYPLLRVMSEVEFRQPLIEFDAEENELDVEVLDVEDHDAGEQGFLPQDEGEIRIQNLSPQRVEEPVQADEGSEVALNQASDQVYIKIEESKHDECRRMTLLAPSRFYSPTA